MPRRYQVIWDKLKVSKQVTVRCRPDKKDTLIQGVMKEKSKENAPRKNLDLPSYGRLEHNTVKIAADMVAITFHLLVSNRAEDL